MGVEILGVDSGGDAEREANHEMRVIGLADTTQTTPLGSRTFRFLYASTLRQRSQDTRNILPGQAGTTSFRIVATVSVIAA